MMTTQVKRIERQRKSFVNAFRSVLFEQQGSITVETTITFPVIMLMVLFLLFSILFFYEKANLLQRAQSTAMVTAEQWGLNSGNDSGSGLYWRWKEGGVVGWLYNGGRSDHVLQLPLDEQSVSTRPLHKLANEASKLPDHLQGSLRYHNHLFFPKIHVELRSNFHIPVFDFDERPAEEAGFSTIIDPVEWIRNVDLIIGYASELKERWISKEEAEQSIHRFLNLDRPNAFDRHDPAAAYLRQLVAGKEKVFPLQDNKSRLIDAYTDQGIAHQAYLTFTESQIRTQMDKDVELLKQGAVNGVVWHFFRRTNQTGRVGPSSRLMQDLKANGIVVVIHD